MMKKITWLMIVLSLLLIVAGLCLFLNPELLSNDDKKDVDSPFDVLKEAYEKTKISNMMNGYSMTYMLIGKNGEKEYLDTVEMINYKNTKYKITEKFIDNTEKQLSEPNVYYIIDGITFLEKNDGKYEKVEEIIYNNTGIYLEGISSVQKLLLQTKESLGSNGVEYDKYVVLVDANNVAKMVTHTNVGDISFVDESIACVVWIDENGYIFRMDYDLSSGINGDDVFSIIIVLENYNKIENFTLDKLQVESGILDKKK